MSDSVPTAGRFTRRAGISSLLWLLPAFFLVVFFVTPLARIFSVTILSAIDQPLPTGSVWRAVSRPLGFTVYQAALSTLLTMLVGAFVGVKQTISKRCLHIPPSRSWAC